MLERQVGVVVHGFARELGLLEYTVVLVYDLVLVAQAAQPHWRLGWQCNDFVSLDVTARVCRRYCSCRLLTLAHEIKLASVSYLNSIPPCFV